MPDESEGIEEKCGLVGCHKVRRAAELIYLGLHDLQHRGQESAGMVLTSRKGPVRLTGMGIVNDAFSEADIKRARQQMGIGHVRYSTAGTSTEENIQPFLFQRAHEFLAIAHNGTLIDSEQHHQDWEDRGEYFLTNSDTELIPKNFFHSRARKLEERVFEAVKDIKASFALLMLHQDKLIAVRDPFGFRPLSMGRHKDGGPLFASESCAFSNMDGEYLRDIEPGEILIIGQGNPRQFFFDENGIYTSPTQHILAQCVFENIYFARPDSVIFGMLNSDFRRELGRRNAQSHPLKDYFQGIREDLVIAPVPDSGNPAAFGFCDGLGLPTRNFDYALIRNHYIGRTFIEPKDRSEKVKRKLSVNVPVVKDKVVVLVDDSLIRGITMGVIADMVYKAGAREVHIAVSCPPHRYPCNAGISFPTCEELIVNRLGIHKDNVEKLAQHLKVDSIHYSSQPDLEKTIRHFGQNQKDFCFACLTGHYKIE